MDAGDACSSLQRRCFPRHAPGQALQSLPWSRRLQRHRIDSESGKHGKAGHLETTGRFQNPQAPIPPHECDRGIPYATGRRGRGRLLRKTACFLRSRRQSSLSAVPARPRTRRNGIASGFVWRRRARHSTLSGLPWTGSLSSRSTVTSDAERRLRSKSTRSIRERHSLQRHQRTHAHDRGTTHGRRETSPCRVLRFRARA